MKKYLLIPLVLLSATLYADPVKIFLRSGRTIAGEILAQNPDVLVLQDTRGRRFQLPASDIQRIGAVSDPDPEPAQQPVQQEQQAPEPEQTVIVQAPAIQEQPIQEPEQPAQPETPQPAVKPIEQTPVYATDQQPQSSYNLAKAALFSGVYVFSHSQPAQPYTILGEVSFSGKGAVYFYQVGGITTVGNSSVYYAEMRNSLVGQAIMANRDVDGIIIKGKNATLIKFDADTPNKDLALVDKVRGVLIFLDSEPVRQYDYIKTKKVGIADETDKTIDKFARQANSANNGVQAIIIHCGDKYIERADFIRFSRW